MSEIIGYVVMKPMENMVLTTIYKSKQDADKFKSRKDAELPRHFESEHKVCGLVEV